MIKESIVKGSRRTTIHNFSFSINEMNITVSKGSYYRDGIKIFSSETDCNVSIPNRIGMNYEIFIVEEEGFVILQYVEFEQLLKFVNSNKIIDKIAWFKVDKEISSLSEIDINVLKIIDSDGE